MLEVPREREESYLGGSAPLTGSKHRDSAASNSAHLGSRVEEGLRVDSKGNSPPCCWASWNKAVVATEWG